LREIPFLSQVGIQIKYKDIPLKKKYIAYFLAYDKIFVELKTESHLSPIDQPQLINYLKATGFELGLLINFAIKIWNGKESFARMTPGNLQTIICINYL